MAYAADRTPLELTALTSLATDDTFVVGDTSDVSEVAKSITKANLITDLTTSFATAAQGATADAAVVANSAITGATKTKITYDAKGLVTVGADATTADIAASTDKNYVTDAQAVVIGNTSGANTGDQTNISGNAATVTTNANLTGHVTSVGNAAVLGSFTSAQLATAITDETGSGAAVFATTPTLVTPVLGVATATSVNKVALTAPATSATLTIADGKTLTASNSITLAGTDATVMTFPTTTSTLARTSGTNTFTGIQSMTSPAVTTSITTPTASFTAFAGATTLLTIGGTGVSASLFAPSTLDTSSSTTGAIRTSGGVSAAKALNIGTTATIGGAITSGGVAVPTISSTNTLTNKRITPRVGSTTSSATPTINTDNTDAYHLTAQAADITSFTTNLSGTPTDFQQLRISVTGTAARSVTWGASFENGPVALPTVTTTTLRMDTLFMWNAVTSKWRCMASGSTV